jgi:haloalkane dehalogenase
MDTNPRPNVKAGHDAALPVSHQAGAGLADPFKDFLKLGFTRRVMDTPAGRLSWHEAGQGQPLVFLHGIGGGASSWGWIAVAPSFAADHRVIVPDWVGWGQSDRPEKFLLFEDYVTELEILLRELGQPALVVAQSLASGFALALAERRPELFRQVILHTPTGGKDFGRDIFGPIARATLYPLTTFPRTGLPLYRAFFHRRWFIESWLRQQGFLDASKVTPAIIDAFLFNASQPHAGWSALPFVNGQLRYDLVPYLERSTVPVSIFCGNRDSVVGLERVRRLAAVRSGLPLDVIESAKSCPELEQPAAVIATLRSQLAG